jgi:hypothetical protein
MQLKGIIMHGWVGRGRYRPAANNSTGYETNMVGYGIHSASIEMYRRAADTTLLTLSVQIPAPSKLGIHGSLCRLCRLPADKRLSAARCYRRPDVISGQMLSAMCIGRLSIPETKATGLDDLVLAGSRYH